MNLESSGASEEEIFGKQGGFQVVDELPSSIKETLGFMVEAILKESSEEGVDRKYLVLNKEDAPAGFVALDVGEKSEEVDLIYRWVSGEKRGEGIGRELRERLHDWALQEGDVKRIKTKVISNVVEVTSEADVLWGDSNMGGPASYRSVIKAGYHEQNEGKYPFQEVLVKGVTKPEVFGDVNGKIDLGIVTHVRNEDGDPYVLDEPSLPDDPKDLFNLLHERALINNEEKRENL